MNAKRVLIITYYFPPRPGVASLRLQGLAKYLPKFGWKPTVLTAKLPRNPDPRFDVVQTYYPGSISEIVKRKINLNPKRGFQEQIGIPYTIRGRKRSITNKLVNIIKEIVAYPDEEKLWYPYAVKEGIKLLKHSNFDAILSSSGPVTVNLVAHKLKAVSGLSWIADFRDLWTQNHYYQYSNIRKMIEKKLEIKTLSTADALVTVSSPLANKLKELHKGKQVFTITNGFDPEEFEVNEYPLTKKFTITYTGQLYYGKQNPELLLKALQRLIMKKVIDPTVVEIRFFGPKEYWLDQEIKRYHLEGVVEQYGVVPREVALVKQRESHILLLLNWDDPREIGIYTGKVFEYLAAKRPIIAIGGPSNSVVNELLEKTNAGIHTSNLESAENIILEFYKQYKILGSVKYLGKKLEINKYSHFEMAKKFADVMDFLREKEATIK